MFFYQLGILVWKHVCHAFLEELYRAFEIDKTKYINNMQWNRSECYDAPEHSMQSHFSILAIITDEIVTWIITKAYAYYVLRRLTFSSQPPELPRDLLQVNWKCYTALSSILKHTSICRLYI